MTMPAKIRAEWIWKKSLLFSTNSFLFLRREFEIDEGLAEADIWITAHSSYQLFINNQFIGFGPSPSGSQVSYADRYDVSDYLNLGINVIGILVYFNSPQQVVQSKQPGLWCQLDIDQKPKVWSNQTWMTHNARCFEQSRARMYPTFDFNESIDLNGYPWGWREPLDDDTTHGWHDVDFYAKTEELGINIKESPLKEKRLDGVYNITSLHKGSFSPNQEKTVTYANFKKLFLPGIRTTYAAKAFIFSEEDRDIAVKVVSDDPYKFFCDRDLVSEKLPIADNNPSKSEIFHDATIKIKHGWNSLVFIQEVHENGMGFFLEFSDNNIELLHDTIEGSKQVWSLIGPLKMPIRDSSPSINFERLELSAFKPDIKNISDIASYLAACKFEKYNDDSHLDGKIFLKEGEYITMELDSLRYGFPCFECGGNEGDIVDYTFATSLDDNGVAVTRGVGKNTHTTIMKSSRSRWLKFSPIQCKYIMISVRKAARNVNIKFNVFFDYMLSTESSTIFSCSDDDINTIWRAGKNAFRHSAVHMPLNTLRPNQSLYMIDAYIQSLNAVTIFGDYSYSEAYLRKFAEAQFENGNIPAISPEVNCKSQLDHLFIFPVWLSYHYRANPNPQLVRDMVPHLMMIFRFFESIRAEHDELLPVLDMNTWGKTKTKADKNVISFLSNALYCRFLLSSRELYQTVGLKASAHHYWNIAIDISLKLKKLGFNKKQHLFSDYITDGKPGKSYSATPNIMGLYSGIHSSNEFKDVMKNFFEESTPFEKMSDEAKNPYFNFVFLEILFALQEKTWAISYLKNFWMNRLDKNLVTWKNNAQNASDKALPEDLHSGGTISPNFFLVRELAGVRLAEAGYSAFYLNPAFEILDWAKVTIPTINGKLHVEWKNMPDGGLDITIESDFPVRVVPEFSEEMLAESIFQVGANVTLLDPSSAP
jgi:Bacterial alpha-L-rhamnosidase 6 hairpin glycosidase domain/Bacterial alpha-L-rhamnosidase C-terminal domain